MTRVSDLMHAADVTKGFVPGVAVSLGGCCVSGVPQQRESKDCTSGAAAKRGDLSESLKKREQGNSGAPVIDIDDDEEETSGYGGSGKDVGTSKGATRKQGGRAYKPLANSSPWVILVGLYVYGHQYGGRMGRPQLDTARRHMATVRYF